MDWKVVQPLDLLAVEEGAYERQRLFSRSIPENRWVDLPPPIQRREDAQEDAQGA